MISTSGTTQHGMYPQISLIASKFNCVTGFTVLHVYSQSAHRVRTQYAAFRDRTEGQVFTVSSQKRQAHLAKHRGGRSLCLRKTWRTHLLYANTVGGEDKERQEEHRGATKTDVQVPVPVLKQGNRCVFLLRWKNGLHK